MRNSINEEKRNCNNCNPETTTNAEGQTRNYLQDGGGTGWLIDNHYMAQAMSDENP